MFDTPTVGLVPDQYLFLPVTSVTYLSDRTRTAGDPKIFALGSESVSRSSKRSYQHPFQPLTLIKSSSGHTAQSGSNVADQAYAAPGLSMDVLEQCRKEFVKVASSEQVEYGYSSASEQLLDRFLDQHKASIGGIVQHIYVREGNNSRIIIPLLKAVSSFSYTSVYPYAQIMALAALSNADPEVCEAGIRAYENWGSADGISHLKNAKTPWGWLDSYRLETIEYLETFA